jgi:hypothetical protein
MLMKEICNKEQMPPDWSVEIIYPVYKKGDRRECGNYRGAGLLSCMYTVICNRLMDYTQNITGDCQNGFRTNRGMANNAHKEPSN